MSGGAAALPKRCGTKSAPFIAWFEPALLTGRSQERCLNKEGEIRLSIFKWLMKTDRGSAASKMEGVLLPNLLDVLLRLFGLSP